MSKYLSPRDIDWTVLLIVLLICGVGVLQIYSATRDTDYTSAWWKQVVYVLGGLVFMWVAMAIDYHTMLHYVPALYISSVWASERRNRSWARVRSFSRNESTSEVRGVKAGWKARTATASRPLWTAGARR